MAYVHILSIPVAIRQFKPFKFGTEGALNMLINIRPWFYTGKLIFLKIFNTLIWILSIRIDRLRND